jgi:hypothetical protein
MPPTCRDLEIVKIGSDENDAGGSGSRQNANRNRNAAVKPDPRSFDATVNRRLESQASSPDSMSLFQQLRIVSSSF